MSDRKTKPTTREERTAWREDGSRSPDVHRLIDDLDAAQQEPAWNFLPTPTPAAAFDNPCDCAPAIERPWKEARVPQLLIDDGDTVVLGDWQRESVADDEGCGCCSSERPDLIVAWRDLWVWGTP